MFKLQHTGTSANPLTKKFRGGGGHALNGGDAVNDPWVNVTKNSGMGLRQGTAAPAVHHAVVPSCISKKIEGIEVIRFRIVEEKQGFVIVNVHKS